MGLELGAEEAPEGSVIVRVEPLTLLRVLSVFSVVVVRVLLLKVKSALPTLRALALKVATVPLPVKPPLSRGTP